MGIVKLWDQRGQKHTDLLLNVMVSLFNGISTFVGYLMPKPFS